MSKYILSIDQGTTGSTVVIVDKQLNLIGKASKELSQHYPRPGWVEHDPEEIWASVEYTVKATLDFCKERSFYGFGLLALWLCARMSPFSSVVSKEIVANRFCAMYFRNTKKS
jgi:hypothetical protein